MDIHINDKTYQLSWKDNNILEIFNDEKQSLINISLDDDNPGSFKFDSFHFMIKKNKDKEEKYEFIISCEFDLEYDDYKLWYKEHGLSGFSDDPVKYINLILKDYPDIIDLLGECESKGDTNMDLTFTNIPKLMNKIINK